MNTIYLDHNASTSVYAEVLEAMLPYFKENYGNASSVHQHGQKARKAIEEARVHLAKFINAADPNEIIFTSGGTESNNMAVKGALHAFRKKGKRFVSSAIEHSAIRQVLQQMVETDGIDNVVVPVQSNGILNLNNVDEAMTPDTILVTIMLANNEIGTLQPIQEIAALCKKKNVVFHTDAVQAAGKLNIDVQALGVDMLSLSGHKFGAPKGVGILYIKKGTRLASLVSGGSQERMRRGGTENVAGIVGMGVAAQLVIKNLKDETARVKNLRDQFEKNILSSIPSTSVNGDLEKRTCNTSNISFDFTDSSALVMALDLKGVCCSNGSACASGNPDPSHVLLALGLPQDKAHASIRFSLGHTTTQNDIDRAIPIIQETVAKLRAAHPLWSSAVTQKKAANS